MIFLLGFFVIGLVFGWYRFMRDKRRAWATATALWLLSILGSVIFRMYVYRETGISMGRLEVYFLFFMPLLCALLLGYFAGEILKYVDIRINGEHFDIRGGRGTIFVKNLFGRILPAPQYGQSLAPETRIVTTLSFWLYGAKVPDMKRLIHAISFVLRTKSEDKLVIRQMLNAPSHKEKSLKHHINKMCVQNELGPDEKRNIYAYLVHVGIRCHVDFIDIRDELKSTAEILDVDLITAQGIIQDALDQASASTI